MVAAFASHAKDRGSNPVRGRQSRPPRSNWYRISVTRIPLRCNVYAIRPSGDHKFYLVLTSFSKGRASQGIFRMLNDLIFSVSEGSGLLSRLY